MTVGAKSDEDRKRKARFKKEEVGAKEVGAEEVGAKAGNADVQVDEEEVEEEGNVAEGEGGLVHEGFFCNGCQMQPIVGARYKCLECGFLVSSVHPFTDDIVFSVVLRALITTCARPVRRVVSTPPVTICS